MSEKRKDRNRHAKAIFMAALQWRLGKIDDADFKLAIAVHLNEATGEIFEEME